MRNAANAVSAPQPSAAQEPTHGNHAFELRHRIDETQVEEEGFLGVASFQLGDLEKPLAIQGELGTRLAKRIAQHDGLTERASSGRRVGGRVLGANIDVLGRRSLGSRSTAASPQEWRFYWVQPCVLAATTSVGVRLAL